MTEYRNRVLGLTELRNELLPLLLDEMRPENGFDPMSRILKCHLLTEHVLESLLRYCLEPNGDAVLSADLTYSKKLDIASKCMLVDDYQLLDSTTVGSLRKLNKLRNRIAHKFNTVVESSDVFALFVNVDHLMPIDQNETDIGLIAYHYCSFIFGHMLPKYELSDDGNNAG